MSEEQLSDDFMHPALVELETSLRGLSAAGNVNRDELLFEAGRRSAVARSSSRSNFWKAAATGLAMMLVVETVLFLPATDSQIVDRNSQRDGFDKTGVETGENSPSGFSDDDFVDRTGNENEEVSPAHPSQYLRLRRLALSHGVDAALSTIGEAAGGTGGTGGSGSNQQELLRELLGS